MAAWRELHAANERLGWFVGRPAFEPQHPVPWSKYAFDPFEKQKLGKRSRESTAVGKHSVELHPRDGAVSARDQRGASPAIECTNSMTPPKSPPKEPTTLAELRALSDEEIVYLHDIHFEGSTKASTRLYVDELNRRASEREATAMQKLASESNQLARQSNRLALFAVAISLIALVVTIAANPPIR